MLRDERSEPHTLSTVDGRYVCADNLRFVCMFGVVSLHCARVLTFSVAEDSPVDLLRIAILTLLKFSTIGFFIVSGFLLERNLQSCDPFKVIGKRVRKVFLPWSFWFILTCCVESVSDLSQHKRAFAPGFHLHTAVLSTVDHIMTGTALWFVPNLLVSLIALLILRRYLQRVWVGLVLLGVNLFYTVSIYTGWTDPRHTRAFFAFVFYLWLGNYAARNLAAFSRLMGRIPFGFLGGATGLFVVVSFVESRLLHHLHSIDPTNTLKPSNQILSLLVVLCFFKVRRPFWPRFVDVPRTTFGIYLSHTLLLSAVMAPVYSLMQRDALAPYRSSVLFGALFWLATSVLVWTLGFMVSRFMASSTGLAWMIGAPAPVVAPAGQAELSLSRT